MTRPVIGIIGNNHVIDGHYVTHGGGAMNCAAATALLNKAVELYHAGTYRACDFTTLTTTASSSATSLAATTSVTSSGMASPIIEFSTESSTSQWSRERSQEA